jgi:hypothetical protein
LGDPELETALRRIQSDGITVAELKQRQDRAREQSSIRAQRLRHWQISTSDLARNRWLRELVSGVIR